MNQIGCVIMASGEGKRFGENKLLAPLGGKPLICWAMDATHKVFDRRVVVTRHTEVAALCRDMDIPVILHDLPYRSDTVRLGLEELEEGLSGCMFLPGDQPLIQRKTLQTMVQAAKENPKAIWQLRDANSVGSPLLFPQWTFSGLKSLPQGKGGSVIAREYADAVRYIFAEDSAELEDVDRPEDLERAQKRLIGNALDKN